MLSAAFIEAHQNLEPDDIDALDAGEIPAWLRAVQPSAEVVESPK